ncbi:cytochrome b562 [Vibrio sp. S4M6]|uniref:cytochrome b562 n=1 Tax=Vibrio sinus TaxID=2946865 RepID=UPI00202A3395|nr:cytochrome b562 [Vibrio sinus]MCL9780823.1 cytochrome b562 [Vibrio sinus]
MAKVILLTIGLFLSMMVQAQENNLSANMKQMKLEFNLAVQAVNLDEMRVPISNLQRLVSQSKALNLPIEKRSVYQEGFKRLSAELDRIQVKIDTLDLAGAKDALQEIDSLRVEYHNKRNPSIWERLFC